jgi:hypothetical protein
VVTAERTYTAPGSVFGRYWCASSNPISSLVTDAEGGGCGQSVAHKLGEGFYRSYGNQARSTLRLVQRRSTLG